MRSLLFIFLSLSLAIVLNGCKTDQVVSKSPFQKRKYTKGVHTSICLSGFDRKRERIGQFSGNIASLKSKRFDTNVEELKQKQNLPNLTASDVAASPIAQANEPATMREVFAHQRQKREEFIVRMVEKLPLHRTSDEVEEPVGARKEVQPLAILGLITGIVGLIIAGIPLGLLSIVFGVIAIARVSKHPEKLRGYRLAVAAVILGMVDIILALVFVTLFL